MISHQVDGMLSLDGGGTRISNNGAVGSLSLYITIGYDIGVGVRAGHFYRAIAIGRGKPLRWYSLQQIKMEVLG